MTDPARILIQERHELHLIGGLDTQWHQLDERCACDPVIYVFGSVFSLWTRIEHLHYGPEEEFVSEPPS